jgi:hypothetical protein
MKVEQQLPVIRYTVELTPEEVQGLRNEIKDIARHNQQEVDDDDICVVGFPHIGQLVKEILEA